MINEWWVGDDRERFWMEITNRTDLGANLWAPQIGDNGREYWSYSLVKHVRPGDIVLHWSKQAGPAMIAYSHVTGPYEVSQITWQSRGTYGRTRPVSGEEPGWLAPLSGATTLRSPVTQQRLREFEEQIRQIRNELAKSINGPLYFPFALSDRRPVRAAQGYLTKIPYDLVSEIPELSELLDIARSEPGDAPGPPRRAPTRGQNLHGGRQSDSEVRRAIEHHAVETVMTLYDDDGYEVEDVGDYKSWDITGWKDGEEVHIEVKGSAGLRTGIDLTEGEVRHAEDFEMTHLVIVDGIDWTRTEAGIKCSGGRVRRCKPWVANRSTLIPTTYRYPLPELENLDQN